jgi:hypothetical protein
MEVNFKAFAILIIIALKEWGVWEHADKDC